MAPRVQYRRTNSYNTRSNKVRNVRTPGGKVVVHYVKKTSKVRRCPESGKIIHGIPCVGPYKLSLMPKYKRSVSRAYGGVLAACAVRQRILRAFLCEEAKIVDALAKARGKEAAKAKAAEPAAPKAAKTAKAKATKAKKN